MTATRRQWERKALEGLVEHLRNQNHVARITSWPENDPADPLSVDARIVIDGQEWAADHQRIVYDSQHPAAEKAARNYLRPRLEELASRHRVGFYPPRWGKGDPLPPGMGSDRRSGQRSRRERPAVRRAWAVVDGLTS